MPAFHTVQSSFLWVQVFSSSSFLFQLFEKEKAFFCRGRAGGEKSSNSLAFLWTGLWTHRAETAVPPGQWPDVGHAVRSDRPQPAVAPDVFPPVLHPHVCLLILSFWWLCFPMTQTFWARVSQQHTSIWNIRVVSAVCFENSFHYKCNRCSQKYRWGSSHCGTYSGLRIWRCLWGSLDSILGPRTSIGHGCGWKMKNQPTNQPTKPSDIYSCTILEARSPRLRSKKFSFFWDLSCWLAFGQLSSELAMQKQRELCCLSIFP